MDYRMIVSDLDDTLVDSACTVCAALIRRIAALEEKGAIFTVATGRSPGEAKSILDQLSLSVPQIFCNGAILAHQGITLDACYFDARALLPWLQMQDRRGVTIAVSSVHGDSVVRGTAW